MPHDPNVPIPDASSPERSPTGGLPSDFFEGKGGRSDDLGEPAFPPRVDPTGRGNRAARGRATGERRPLLAVVATVLAGNVVFLMCGVLAGWALTRKGVLSGREESPPLALPTVTATVRPGEPSEAPSAIEGVEAKVRELRTEVAALGRGVARLEGRLDAQPKPSPPPDLAPLAARIDRLAESNGRLTPLPGEIRTLLERFDALESRVGVIGNEVVALVKATKGAGETTGASASGTARAQGGEAEETRSQAAALFKEGRFREARDVFLQVARNAPDDARAWYFAALANGFATQEWSGETERLVKRGIEREQAGTPARAEIDALFADLTRDQGQAWLKEWRERALSRPPAGRR